MYIIATIDIDYRHDLPPQDDAYPYIGYRPTRFLAPHPETPGQGLGDWSIDVYGRRPVESIVILGYRPVDMLQA